MKLIPLLFFMSIAVDVRSNEHYTFPPKFHPHNGVMSTSDSSIYLPPESHTAIPYFPIKNENNLQYPYLPMTGTKAPAMFPTPFHIMMSSTMRPNEHDDDDDEENDDDNKQQSQFMKMNRTVRSHPERSERNIFRPAPNHQPIDRVDKKIPYGFMNNPPVHPNVPVQKASSRSMIISEHQRNDLFDQFKAAAALPGPSYLPAPGMSGVYVSSTTETAVPIIRLSNEMDLDGSFSYEALGADQTHYVQHSRMENTGTDKEEQIVEGSYSYVGDNGQTYTVHYIADSKGFRASGDHLPVAPPVPEIIQRAVQYNLAEEAKKPPNLKSWQNDNNENDWSDSEKFQRFIAPPPRPLFTGKTPQSFSFNFGQGSQNSQANSLVASANSQNPSNSNNDMTMDQMKAPSNNIVSNGGPISPQITFLATQGAHNPSANPPQPMSRVFTTERPTLPQIVNYEAGKESDQENNKALWRWQYGLNANMNQTPEKNTISRSSGEGDNVIINFSDMTPEQYTKMIRSELEPKNQNHQIDSMAHSSNPINNYQNPHESSFNRQNDEINQMMMSTESNYVSTQPLPKYNDNVYQNTQANKPNENHSPVKSTDTFVTRSKLITQNNFLPQSQTVTQSYDYEESSYEPKRIVKASTNLAPINIPYNNHLQISNIESGIPNEPSRIIRSSTMEPPTYTLDYSNVNNYESGTQNTAWSNEYSNQVENIHKISTTEVPRTTTESKIKSNIFENNEYSNQFRPIQPQIKESFEETTPATEGNFEDILNENIFLKNLFKMNKPDQYEGNKIRDENKLYQQKISIPNIERKPEKVPKFIQMQTKGHNDIKAVKRPVDLMDIMNYLSTRNHFESGKVKPKSKYAQNTYNQRSEVHYIPMQHEHLHDNDDDEEHNDMEFNVNNHRTNYYHPKELQGIIKNYKVLQRNNSAFNNGQDEQLTRNLSPPPAKNSNLPPLGRAGPSTKSYLPPIYV